MVGPLSLEDDHRLPTLVTGPCSARPLTPKYPRTQYSHLFPSAFTRMPQVFSSSPIALTAISSLTTPRSSLVHSFPLSPFVMSQLDTQYFNLGDD